MKLKTVGGIIILAVFSCTGGMSHQNNETNVISPAETPLFINEVSAIPLPDGFSRVAVNKNSFADWLRSTKLKKEKTVYLFDGSVKPNQSAQYAVLDISVGNKNLQQCADAIMRLRAEYLYAEKNFDAIIFTDNEGGVYKFNKPYNRDRFTVYLERVFGMCGSASLSKELKPIPMHKMQVGDVLIKGGFPGHAVIIMDMAEDEKGEKIYLLAQSYMPAQDIHVLKNPNDGNMSPWYKLNEDKNIYTPEYHFTSEQLKTW